MEIKDTPRDGDKQSILEMAFDSVKKVAPDRFIVCADDVQGVITLDQGIIIPCIYDEITVREGYFKVYGKMENTYPSWEDHINYRINGLFNMDGKEIVPLGSYNGASAIEGFGLALFDTENRILVLASITEKVRNDLHGERILNIGVCGHVALVGAYHGRAENEDEHIIQGRTVKALLDLELNAYKDLNHLYDEIEIVGDTIKAIKDGTYTYIDKYGIPKLAY